jgi:hypothetical protein
MEPFDATSLPAHHPGAFDDCAAVVGMHPDQVLGRWESRWESR